MTNREPTGERIKGLETEMSNLKSERDRMINVITEANAQTFKALSGNIEGLRKFQTDETNRMVGALRPIVFALVLVGGVTVGTTKVAELIYTTIYKAIQ